MQREREREKGRRFSPLLHRDSASLLPFQGYSCVAFRTGTFQHFRFALSSRNLRFLFARRGNKNPLSSHICAWFLLFRSSWDSCVKCIIIWIVPILFDSLSLSLSLSFSLSLSLGGFEKESRLTSVVRPIRGDRSSRLALRARVRRTIRNERIRNRIGI